MSSTEGRVVQQARDSVAGGQGSILGRASRKDTGR